MSLENQSMLSKTVNLSKHVPASDLKSRITFVSGTLRKTMHAMKQLREIPPFKGVRTVYLAFVESRIIHCIIGFRSRVDENALVQSKHNCRGRRRKTLEIYDQKTVWIA